MGLLVFYGILGWVGEPGRVDIFYDDIVPTITGMILLDSIIDRNWDVFWNAVSHTILPATILGAGRFCAGRSTKLAGGSA